MSDKNQNKSEIWIPPFHAKQQLVYDSPATEILWAGDTRGGKALSLNELLPLYKGGFTTVRNVKVGDVLIDEKGMPCEVLEVHPVISKPEAYLLTFDNGQQIKACKDHRWETYSHKERISLLKCTKEWREQRKKTRKSQADSTIKCSDKWRKAQTERNKNRVYNYKKASTGTVRSTKEIYETLRYRGRTNHSIRVCEEIKRPDIKLPINPYLLGVWLGDGCTTSGKFYGIDKEVWETIEKLSYEINHYGITRRVKGLTAQLRKNGLLGNKHIPEIYFSSSSSQILELIKGLLDTDGTVDKRGKVQFCNTNEKLVNDLYILCSLMGWKSFITSKIPKLKGKEHKRCYILTFNPDRPVFNIKRKRDRQKIDKKKATVTKWHYIVQCKPCDPEPMRCITVNNSKGLFLASKSFIPTHNTYGTKLSLIIWCSQFPGLQCDIFRLREDDVIAGYMQGDTGFPVLLAEWIRSGLVKHNQTSIRFWNGSLIELNHCWTDAALTKHQGVPKHVRVIDEAGQIPERRLKWLKLWMTMSVEAKAKLPPELRGRFPKIIYLMNRLGPSKNYFRKVFVKSRPKYQIEQVGAFKQQYIPAFVTDNPSEDIEATIARVTEAADSATAKALLSEDGWDAQTGNYFQQWDSDKNVIKDFVIPDFWLRFRTFDYGSYEPWACIWVAVSPGESIHKGTPHERYLPRGCLVVYREWYGCKSEHPKTERDELVTNLAPEGWTNKDIAIGIIERTEERFDNQPTFTDKFPFNNLGGRTIATEFKQHGLELTLGDTDRRNGWAQMASRLTGEKLILGSENRFPMLVFFESCKYCQDYVPMIERNPDEGKLWDAQEDGEATHICDCIRLACMAHPVVKDAPVDTAQELHKAITHKRNTKPRIRDLVPDLGI